MIVYDVTNPESLENVAAVWVKEVRNYASRDPKILLIGNKSDLKGKMSDAERERIDHLAREVQEQLSEGGGSGTVDVIETSAKTGSGVATAFNKMVDHMVAAVRSKVAAAAAVQQERARRGTSLLAQTKRCESSWCCGLM